MEINFLNMAQSDAAGALTERAAAAANASQTNAEARRSAEEFEAIFIAQMMGPMFNTISTDGPFGGGHSETIYRSMMVEQMGKDMATRGGLGIADAVYRELVHAQEMANGTAVVPPDMDDPSAEGENVTELEIPIEYGLEAYRRQE